MAAFLLPLLLVAGCATFKPRLTALFVDGQALTLYEAHQEEVNRLCREKGGFSYDVAGCWVPAERTIYCSLSAVGCVEHELCHVKGRERAACERLTYVDWKQYSWR